jgi:hypothetical protein
MPSMDEFADNILKPYVNRVKKEQKLPKRKNIGGHTRYIQVPVRQDLSRQIEEITHQPHLCFA